MRHSRSMNDEINRLHETYFYTIYTDRNSFEE